LFLVEGSVELHGNSIAKTYFGYRIVVDPHANCKFATLCAGPALLAKPLAQLDLRTRPSSNKEIAGFKQDVAIAAKINYNISVFVETHSELTV
jgi:hypothetical protein